MGIKQFMVNFIKKLNESFKTRSNLLINIKIHWVSIKIHLYEFLKRHPGILLLFALFCIPVCLLLFYIYSKYIEVHYLSLELEQLVSKLAATQKDLDLTLSEVKELKDKLEKTSYDLKVGKEVLYKTAQDLRIARNDLFRAIYEKVK